MLLLNKTSKTPLINFDFNDKKLTIVGICVPENAKEFFSPLFTALDNFKNNYSAIYIEIQLDYFNTSSSKELLNFLIEVSKLRKHQFKEVKVEWIYLSDDDEMLEAGQIFEDMVDLPFAYSAIDN
jgi:hypothetical protein